MSFMNFVRLLREPKPAPPPAVVVKPELPKPELPMTFVFTDGGCNTKKGGVGAWAWRATRLGSPPRQRHGAMMDTTVNRMELMAVLDALVQHDGDRITIYSDSLYVINGLTDWHPVWQAKGWLTRDGKPVKNRDLWELLIPIAAARKPVLHHVKGHSGVAGNEHVDKLCTQAMNDLHFEWKLGKPVPHDAKGKAKP